MVLQPIDVKPLDQTNSLVHILYNSQPIASVKSFYFCLDTRIIDLYHLDSIRLPVYLSSLSTDPPCRRSMTGFTLISTNFFFFLIISIFVTVPSANNNNAGDNRGNAWNREHFQTQIREFVRWIKALSSFSREEIRGRWRERWNSIFQSCIRKQWWRGGIGQTGRPIRPVSSLRYRNGSDLSLSLSLIHTLFFHSISILLITYYF